MQSNLHHVNTRIERLGVKPRRRRRWPIGSAAVAVLILASAVVFAATRRPHAPPLDAMATAALPAWIDIPQPIELFGLDAPDLPKIARLYEAHRHRTGGGRQDILTFGKLSGDEPFIRLMLYRVGAEQVQQAPLFVELARLGADAGISIARSLTPEDLATRFGDFETADVDLVADAGLPTPCLGFRGVALDGGFRMTGFACGVPAKPLSRPALACLLDRLDLNSAGDDSALASFFAATEMRRDPICAGTGLAPMALQVSWIDQDDALPPLRLRKER
jgi:hypothetical protein